MTARGNERKPIYRDERDRMHFIELFARCGELFRLRLHAYVLMPNHYHVLLETQEANLSRAMQWLNTSYTIWFNRRHQRAGHLLQGRFKAVVVEADTWAVGVSRYIHLNPVRIHRMELDKRQQQSRRRGLGQRASAAVIEQRQALLRDYRWSSYRAYAGYEKCPAWLETQAVLSRGGGWAKEWRRHYRQDCQAAVKDGAEEEESPWKSLVGSLALGSEDFVEELLKEPHGKDDEELKSRLCPRPGFEEIIAVVEEMKKERWEDFRDRRGDWGRELALYLGRQKGGMSLRELCEAAGASTLMAVSLAIRRFRHRLSSEKPLIKAMRQASKKLET